jgi:hypothetical protein
MSTYTFHDVEQLSAFLDGQLNRVQKTRLEARIKVEPALAEALEELRQVRTMLRRTPHRRAPRNFTLTPKMAGIRPPVPRLVPALSWASAIAMVLFVFTVSINLLQSLSFGAASPKAIDRYGLGGGPAAAATSAPALAPAATQPPAALSTPELFGVATQAANGTGNPTATMEASSMAVPGPTTESVMNANPPPAASRVPPKLAIPWMYIWLVSAVLLVSAALLIRWLSERAFARRSKH